MSARRPTVPPRDQEASAFSRILQRLCETTRAWGAALVDQEGETVDYAGYRDPFALRVMAAEWRIALDIVRAANALDLPSTRELVVRAGRRSFGIFALSEGYALVVELPSRAFALSHRALSEAVRALEHEAELPPARPAGDSERWLQVEVETQPGDRRRPRAVRLEGSWHPVTILGRHRAEQGRAWGEVAYRARVPTGLEFALVREPFGAWFASDLC
jgi:hypothetical protein